LLNGEPTKLPAYVPENIAKLVYRLLDKDPVKRIKCQDAIDYMNEMCLVHSFGKIIFETREDKLEECIEKRAT
jgi:hypothetical protein